MRRAIIHIGTPRTGTTTLQAILTARRDELARERILYPDLTPRSAAELPHLSHQYLGEAFDGRRPRRERSELLTSLDAALSAALPDVAILSYEGLCLLPAWSRAPRLLTDLFARQGYRTEILLTVKAQALYIQSQYTWRCQFLREHRPFRRFIAGELRHRRYDYGSILRPWASVAGKVHVVAVHERRTDVPFVERIFAQLGLGGLVGSAITAADLRRRENISLGPATTEVARRLYRTNHVPGDRTRARAITDFISDAARASGLDALSFQAIDAPTAADVEARFRAGNDRLAQRFWGESWERHVPTPLLSPVNEYAERPADERTERLFQEIIAEARKHFELRPRTLLAPLTRGFGPIREDLPRLRRSRQRGLSA